MKKSNHQSHRMRPAKGPKEETAANGSVGDLARKIPFLSCLNDEEIIILRNVIIERQFVKDQVILREEDTPNYLYFIYAGKVKIVQSNSDGKEKVIAVHQQGDFFGEMAILDGRTEPATVVAMEHTRIGLLSGETFHKHFMCNNKILREIVLLLCSRLRDAWSMAKVMSFADAEHRVRAVLKYMGERFGVQDPRGTIIRFRLTHVAIAGFASLSRETVTRIIKRLEKEGEIEARPHRDILLKPAFQK
jgi:CRP/FNR family cyclic AMP-dependent transcriptional regulator